MCGSEESIARYFEQPAEFWNKFYEKNENRFFKDRNWLRIEFPEIFDTAHAQVKKIRQRKRKHTDSPKLGQAGVKRVFEIGCGAGNTLFPLLEQSKNPDLFVYAADYSSAAVQVVQNNPLYDPKRSLAFVWDLSSSETPSVIQPGSIDIVVLIFVLSALAPEEWDQALKNIHKVIIATTSTQQKKNCFLSCLQMLKPGGLCVFRDYGRHDLAQLRFKEGRMLKENFYIRGDGTRVYFFTPEEIASLFSSKGFHIEQNAIDRRLIVNRSRKLKMYRVWLQGKFRKV